METPLAVDLGRIAQDLQIRRVQVESVVQLLDEGNTVPFITRYRKERTGGLNEVVIREIQTRVVRLRELAERKETILKAIEAQGKLTEELTAAIRAADNPKRLEDLYLPYKPKKRTKASEAREKGLEPLALRIWNRDETLTDLAAAAAEFVSEEKGVASAEQALEGVGHILAESINELASVREAVRRVIWKFGKVVTAKAESVAEGQGLDFRDYFAYSEPLHHIPPHRVLALNRGDKEGALKVKIEVPRHDLERALLSQLPLEGHPHQEFFTRAAFDALDRLLLPSLEREVRRDLTDMAERHAVEVFARNLRSLLLQPPVAKQVVLAIDPGQRSGCKVAVLDPFGSLLAHEVIHPHPPQNRRAEAKVKLKDLIARYQVGVVAIGNGTACRETEELIAEIIAEGTYFQAHPGATTYPGSGSRAAAPAATVPEAPAEPVAAPSEPAPAVEEEPSPATPAEPAGAAPMAAAAEEAAETAAEAAAPAEEAAETPPPIAGGAPDGDETTAEPTLEPPPLRAALEPAPEPESEPHPAPLSQPEMVIPTPAEAEPDAEAEPNAETALGAEGSARAEPAATEALTSEAAATEPAAEGTPAPGEEEVVRPVAADFTHPPVGPKPKQDPKPPRPPRPKPPPPPVAPHPADPLLEKLSYVIVNEAGASVYSTSPIGREEFPSLDATSRSAVSIGRRLQDPLAELVKIEPQNIGVGLYQHDVSPKHLKETLEQVVESCVNFVGVDLNTASVSLLRFVSGLNALTAKRLFDHRIQHGPYVSREQIQQVEGIGPVTFTQAAGFLKIRDNAHPFDRTWVHPESYGVATQLLERLGFTPEAVLDKEKLAELHAKFGALDFAATARELNVGEPTLRDIAEALARPDRDPREDLPKPIFKKGVLKLEDLQPGMELKGTVLNVVDFGAFVDIGLKDSGLVHISQLANRYVKSPHDVVSVGDVVTVWVLGVESERKRVSLTMVPPGTERTRGGGGRRGAGTEEAGEPSPAERRGDRGRDRERRAGPPPRGAGQARSPGPPASATGVEPAVGGGSRPAEPQRHLRIPGPPQRHQQRDRGRGGRRPDRRGDRPQAPEGAETAATAPRPKPKPAPPTPLSEDARTGKVPLRTFGQLKQLYEARSSGAPEAGPSAPSTAEPSSSDQGPPPDPET